jgi:hypothetical protein
VVNATGRSVAAPDHVADVLPTGPPAAVMHDDAWRGVRTVPRVQVCVASPLPLGRLRAIAADTPHLHP